MIAWGLENEPQVPKTQKLFPAYYTILGGDNCVKPSLARWLFLITIIKTIIMTKTITSESGQLRVVETETVLTDRNRLIRLHVITYLPRIEGEPWIPQGKYRNVGFNADYDYKRGVWRINNPSRDICGEFTDRVKMTKWVKSNIKRLMGELS